MQIQTRVTAVKRKGESSVRTYSQGLIVNRSLEGRRPRHKDPNVSSLDIWGNSKTKTSEEEQGKRTFSSPRGLALFNAFSTFILLILPCLDLFSSLTKSALGYSKEKVQQTSSQ